MKISLLLTVFLTFIPFNLKAEIKKCQAQDYQLYSWVSLTDFDSLKNYAHKDLIASLSIRNKYLAIEIGGEKSKQISSAKFYSTKINLVFELEKEIFKLNLTGFDLGSYLDQEFKVEIINKRGESCEIALEITRS